MVVQGDKRLVPGRFCAVRKSAEAIKLAEKRLKQTASRKGREIRPETWEYVKYVMVFTTFSPRRFTAVEILQWYRVRWQVELVFKRLKSLAQLGHLPKSDAQSARAWLYGKLFVVLLTEQLLRHGRTLSPSAAPCRTARAAQSVARICVCLASAPAGGGPHVIVTSGDGELAHDRPSPLRMPASTATTDRTIPFSVKLTLMGRNPPARDAQSKFKAIVVQLLGGTGTIISKGLETAVAATAGVATDGQRQGVKDLDGVGRLPTALGQPLLDGGFDLPEVRGLADKERALGQVGKEVRIIRVKVRKEIFVGGQLEILATDLHRDDFFIAQGGGNPAPAQGIGMFDHLRVLTDQTVHSNDKLIPIHWGPPAGKSWCGNRYSTDRLLNGSAA